MRLFALIIALFAAYSTMAQLSIGNGVYNLELSGAVSSYYNHRLLKDGESDQKKNRFKLRDAQLEFEGRYRDLIEIELQFDLADISSAQRDPENTVLRDAYIQFKPISHLFIKSGYMKLPYSRYSLTPFKYQAFWQRAQFARGQLFSRRDVGFTIGTDFWRQLVNVELGVFTGLGESSILGNNDASGNLEFVGRIELSYPTRFRHRNIDTRQSIIPKFTLGVNGRYYEKTQPSGSSLPASFIGDYGLKVLNGSRLAYGGDASFQFYGFSVLLETHWLVARPSSEAHFLFESMPDSVTDGFVRSSALMGEISYHIKRIGITVAARYDQLNINDLAEGIEQNVSAAAIYEVPRIPCQLRFQYFRALGDETSYERTWTDQIRFGFIYNLE